MKIKIKLNTLPEKPGCYLMKDGNNKIIYVGKAINLKKRVSQYFNKVHNIKTTRLVKEVDDFEIIITKNEKEALILEYNLIKKYKPKFNVIFMDDKTYPYIYVSNELYFRVSVIRIKDKHKLKGNFFGPYPNAYAANNLVNLINKIFPIRKCRTLLKKPCTYYHLKQCLGYCFLDIDKNINYDLRKKVIDFLNGNNKKIVKELEEKRNRASEILNFESAQEFQDLINAIIHINDKQNVELKDMMDIDFINYYVSENYLTVCILNFRNGKLLNSHNFMATIINELIDEISSYIIQYYEKNIIPKEIILEDILLKNILDNYFDENILKLAFKGSKKSILNKAFENAKQHYIQNTKVFLKKENYYLKLTKSFKEIFNKDISLIEVFDNSHFYGKDTTGAMIVYKDFKPLKKEYRHYKLNDSYDDLRNMYELLYRRYFKVLKDNKIPDILIVDGGFNQVKIAKKIIKDFNLKTIVLGLIKDSKHNTADLINDKGEIIDLKRYQDVFLFLAKLQDEAHRFALNYNEKLRKKRLLNQELLSIDGIGEKTLIKLLNHFTNLKNIKNATISQLNAVVSLKIAKKVYNYFNDVREFE